MYILKNAWISIKRNPGRNILIGVIVMVIACACSITLAIKNSASTLIKSYEEQYKIEATIGVDRKKLMNGFDPKNSENSKTDMKTKFSDISSITEDDVKKYGDSSYVTSYYYTNSINMNSNNIEKASKTIDEQSDRKGMPNDMKENSADFTITGYSSIEAMTDFINGNYSITEGNVDTDFNNNSCVINNELAAYNNLKVGDKIVLTDPSDTSKSYTLNITGIFTENSNDSGMNMFSNSANNIITSCTVIDNIIKKDSSLEEKVTPTFTLTSKDVIDSFSSELKDKGLSEYLSVQTNDEEASEATSSISNLSTYATTFLIITLVIGAAILFVINMINIRERKYEIGVLRTIGMKKSLLTSQFVLELLIISLVSMILGTGIGAVSSVPTANRLLQNEINNSATKMNKVSNNFGPGAKEDSLNDDKKDTNREMPSRIEGVLKVEKINSIDAIVDIKVVIELLVIGVGITLVSSSAAMISIQKFSPLTILKERS